MGQPVTVVQKSTSRPDVVRFEINRSITGMDPHRYTRGQDVEGDTPADEVARRLFAHPGVDSVHIYSNVITVDLGDGVAPAEALRSDIESLFTYYREGVEVTVPEGAAAD
ncbi:MAG TPA: NifU N-terminal domain-containing protein [Acidimicrobiales bacterium]|nr:NifU N-terminal domain-containing protein [Acidimicrobiales bacterium]